MYVFVSAKLKYFVVIREKQFIDTQQICLLSLVLLSFILFIFVSCSICNNTQFNNIYHYMTTVDYCNSVAIVPSTLHTIVVAVWLVWLTSQTVWAFHLVHIYISKPLTTFSHCIIVIVCGQSNSFHHRILNFATKKFTQLVLYELRWIEYDAHEFLRNEMFCQRKFHFFRMH